MKTIVNKFFIVITFIFGIIDCMAKNNPPAPNPNGRTNGPITPPGLSINDDLYLVFVLGLIYGIYLIYKCQKQKTPI